jgi:hypothetical protein
MLRALRPLFKTSGVFSPRRCAPTMRVPGSITVASRNVMVTQKRFYITRRSQYRSFSDVRVFTLVPLRRACQRSTAFVIVQRVTLPGAAASDPSTPNRALGQLIWTATQSSHVQQLIEYLAKACPVDLTFECDVTVSLSNIRMRVLTVHMTCL